MRTQSELLQEIVRKYQAANQPWPATSRDMAQWAIAQRLRAPQPLAIVSQCADQLARAMRDEYITDAQGRRVRAKHAASIIEGGEQFMLWADIRAAPHKHMAIAFQQRRHQIVGDCRQLKVAVDSYNQNRTPRPADSNDFRFHIRLGRTRAGRVITRIREYPSFLMCQISEKNKIKGNGLPWQN